MSRRDETKIALSGTWLVFPQWLFDGGIRLKSQATGTCCKGKNRTRQLSIPEYASSQSSCSLLGDVRVQLLRLIGSTTTACSTRQVPAAGPPNPNRHKIVAALFS